MGKAEEKTRIFSGSDADMVQASRVAHGLFTEDKPAFISFDSSFADPFGENWLQKIENAAAVSQDSQYVGGQSELTENVETIMENCRTFFQSMKYFIEKAFPGQTAIHVQFGYNDYDASRKSETRMIKFLDMLHKAAVGHSAKLIEAGFPQEKIDNIAALSKQLSDADYAQEMAKKKRPSVTQERITILNDCYEVMQHVCKAGKIIFADDRAKYDQYLLPNERTQEKEEPAAPVN